MPFASDSVTTEWLNTCAADSFVAEDGQVMFLDRTDNVEVYSPPVFFYKAHIIRSFQVILKMHI